MYQKTERLLRVAFILYPVDSIISNKVRKIPMFLNSVIVLRNEIRIVVVTLSGDYLPVIKAGGQAFKMPFTHQCCLIADSLQQLRESLLRTVKYASGIILEFIGATLLSCYHTGATGTT